jgi:diguanylate cyclase (GGDEF)-like protein
VKDDTFPYEGDLPRYDWLTGLLNRRAFHARGRAFFGHGGVRPVILASWDVDHMRAVNHRHGHRIGDQALRHVAERLRMALGATGILARVGGDEFAALLLETSAEEARLLLEAAARGFRAPLEGTDVSVTATCGAAVSLSAEDWPGPWMRADEALYKAKHSNPGGIEFSD